MSCCNGRRPLEYFHRTVQRITKIPDVYRKRLATCGDCSDLKRFHKIVPQGTPATRFDRCSKCGCFVVAKAAIPIERCPNKKW